MVTDDPIVALERQLVSAARRRAAPRRRLEGGFVAVAAAVLVALAVAAGALALLGGRSQPLKPSVTATPSSRQQLVGLLAVLRRPQTQADLSLPGLKRPRSVPHALAQPDQPLIRLAAVAPWGARVYLVPFQPLSSSAMAHLRGLVLQLARSRAGQGELLRIIARGAAPSAAASPAAIEDGRALAFVPLLPHVRPRRALRLVEVVPDGVAHVSLAYASAGRVIKTVAVHGNTAAVQVRPAPRGRLALIWLAPGGQMLRRVVLP